MNRYRRSPLEALIKLEARNQEVSSRLLADTGADAAITPFREAYQVVGDIVVRSGLLSDERAVVTLVLMLRCRYTLDKGVLEVLRLHGNDAYHSLRQAIEAAGSADLVRRKARLTKVWLAAGINDGTYRTYKNEFHTDQLLPKNDDLTKDLRRMEIPG